MSRQASLSKRVLAVLSFLFGVVGLAISLVNPLWFGLTLAPTTNFGWIWIVVLVLYIVPGLLGLPAIWLSWKVANSSPLVGCLPSCCSRPCCIFFSRACMVLSLVTAAVGLVHVGWQISAHPKEYDGKTITTLIYLLYTSLVCILLCNFIAIVFLPNHQGKMPTKLLLSMDRIDEEESTGGEEEDEEEDGATMYD